jgi:hypothetical protein
MLMVVDHNHYHNNLHPLLLLFRNLALQNGNHDSRIETTAPVRLVFYGPVKTHGPSLLRLPPLFS